MNHRPLIERLSNPRNNLAVDSDTVAAALGFGGAVHQPNVALPDNPSPARQVANSSEFSIIDTKAKRPQPKSSLFSIVNARLQSLTPLSQEQQKQISKMQARIIPELTQIDSFIAEVDEARFIAIEVRWEEVRAAGRKLSDSMPALQSELATARGYCNASEGLKARTQGTAEQLFHARLAMNKSAWVSKAELQSADQKLEKAKSAAVEAKQKWLSDVRRMAVVESKIASINATLESYQAELQRLSLELSGEANYDNEFGLSSEPKFYREEQVSGGQQ